MRTTLKPCHCGYQGALAGMKHGSGYFSLSCPECGRESTAFTMDGLVAAWNKAQHPAHGADKAPGP